MNYIKCPECDGNGGKRYTHLGGTSGIMTGFQECKHCNGTGSIEAPAQPPADTPPTLEDVLCDQPQPFIVSSLMLKFLSSGEFIYLVREIVREGYSIPEAQTIAKHLNAQADKEWLVTRNTQPADTPPAAPSEEDVEVLDWHAYSKDLMRRFLDCRNERDALRRKLESLRDALVAVTDLSNVGGLFDGHDELNEYTHEANANLMEHALDRIFGIAEDAIEATKGASDV